MGEEPDQKKPSLDVQVEGWDEWNLKYRSEVDDPDSLRRAEKVLELLESLSLANPRILEVGCSTGWLCSMLAEHGTVTGMDLSPAAIEVAEERVSGARFLAGDFLSMDLGPEPYDLIVSLETIASVEDQSAFCDRISSLLAPRGYLIITSQNRPIWEKSGRLRPSDTFLQELLDMPELQALLDPAFEVMTAGTAVPFGNRGLFRIINSGKLNRIVGAVVGHERLRNAKERMGWGNTLYVAAQKRS